MQYSMSFWTLCIIMKPSTHCALTIQYFTSIMNLCALQIHMTWKTATCCYICIQWHIKDIYHHLQWSGIQLTAYVPFRSLKPWHSFGWKTRTFFEMTITIKRFICSDLKALTLEILLRLQYRQAGARQSVCIILRQLPNPQNTVESPHRGL